MGKKFEVNRTKIKGGFQSGRKVVIHNSKSDLPLVLKIIYRTCAIINRGYYFFSLFCDVGFSLMFGGIPLKLRGY